MLAGDTLTAPLTRFRHVDWVEVYEGPKFRSLRRASGAAPRWPVGTRVIANEELGTIVALYYQEEGWPDGTYALYQIVLDNDDMIFAMYDKDGNGLDYFEFIDILSAGKAA